MSPGLVQLQAHTSFNRAQARRHGHAVNEVQLRQPGLVGSFLVPSDGSRPALVWRSTSWR